MRRTIRIVLVGLLGLSGCASMEVLPDENARAYPGEPALGAPAFGRAALLVDGTVRGLTRRFPGARLETEKQAWNAIRTALEAKGVAGQVTGAGDPAGLRILFEFLLEDDGHPLHRSVSTLTLTAFPLWKMVRLTARARCQVGEAFLPEFRFEEERLVYCSPVLLPFAPFETAAPARRLLTAAGQALTAHVLAWVRRDQPTRIFPHRAPGDD